MTGPRIVDERDVSVEREGTRFRVSETLFTHDGHPYGRTVWEFDDASLDEALGWAAGRGFRAYSVGFVDEASEGQSGEGGVRITWLLHVGQAHADPWDDLSGAWSAIEP